MGEVHTEFRRNKENSEMPLGEYQGIDEHYEGIHFSAKGATSIESWSDYYLKKMVITLANKSPIFEIHPFWAEYCKKTQELHIHVASGSKITGTVQEIEFITKEKDEINLSDGEKVQIIFNVYNYHKIHNPDDLYFKDCAGNVKQIPVYKYDKQNDQETLGEASREIDPMPDSKNGSIIVGI
jgi:hypothetical protein